jgi:signal transduction histidine kinase
MVAGHEFLRSVRIIPKQRNGYGRRYRPLYKFGDISVALWRSYMPRTRGTMFIGTTVMAGYETDGPGTWLVDLPPTALQSWLAVAVAAIALTGFGAVIPFTGTALAELNAFFPSLDAIVFVTDLITSVLLFSQFSISGSRSLLALANGYLFTALIVIPHALTFAGAFSPTGLLGSNIQTGSWLFIFWHLGFAASLLAYALLRREKRAAPVSEASALRAIGWSVSVVFILVSGLTWLATRGATLLPPIILDGRRISSLVVYPISFTMLISAVPIVVLSASRRSVLDQWLMVAALVFILELTLSGLLPSVRFSVDFYVGRVLSLVTSSIVLIVVLAETMWLYARLAQSNAMLLRERNSKLMNMEAMVASIAHEVKQPLGAIANNGAASIRFLRQMPPDLGEAESAAKRTIRDSHRAAQIFDNIRALFGREELKKELLDVNDLIREVLRALESDIGGHGIETRVELASKLPSVMGHNGQLQEVIINLVHNAIEAMDLGDGHRILRVKTEPNGAGAISVAVEDTGPGVSSEEVNTIFEAFVTTKSHGMGLGLAICRMIIERHEGRLSVSPADPRGAIFRIILPQVNLPH